MMHTIIQHSETGAYLTKRGWSADREAALTFRSSLQALDYCCQHNLHTVILVLKFTDPQFDIHLMPFPQANEEEASAPASGAVKGRAKKRV